MSRLVVSVNGLPACNCKIPPIDHPPSTAFATPPRVNQRLPCPKGSSYTELTTHRRRISKSASDLAPRKLYGS